MRRPRRWRRSGYRASNLTYESATGSSTRFVRMMAATPIPAAIAISWITRIWMNRIVTKPMTSVARAAKPGMSSRRKLRRAAVTPSAPSNTSEPNELTIWMPWLTAMANTRNGTRIDMGSIPNPSRLITPSCQTTARAAQVSTRNDRRWDCA